MYICFVIKTERDLDGGGGRAHARITNARETSLGSTVGKIRETCPSLVSSRETEHSRTVTICSKE